MRHILFSTVMAAMLTLMLGGASVASPLEDAHAADVKKDYATEFKLLKPLADKGSAEAQASLAHLYLTGRGVTQDYREAMRLYGLAAAHGGNTRQDIWHLFQIIAAIALDLFPSWIAFHRSHPKRHPILLVNILLGWTIIGWFAVLIWALTPLSATAQQKSI